jgi:hypothetical protein
MPAWPPSSPNPESRLGNLHRSGVSSHRTRDAVRDVRRDQSVHLGRDGPGHSNWGSIVSAVIGDAVRLERADREEHRFHLARNHVAKLHPVELVD